MLNLEKITAAVQEEMTGLMISGARCSLARSHLSRCRACQEVCPVGALTLTEEGPTVKDCLECGLCAGQCPNGALIWKKPSLGELLARVQKQVKDNGVAYLHCAPYADLAKRGRGVQVPCLGSIPWECWLELLLLGEKVKILLPPKGCQNCQVITGERVWQEQLTRAQEILGHKISITPQIPVSRKIREQERELKQRERRQFFSLMFSLAKNTSAKLLETEKGENPPLPSPQRQVLMNFLQKNPEYGAKIQLQLPVFNERCQFCGACSFLCPQGALKQEEGTDGKQLELNRGLCSGCGLCVEICYHQGVELLAQRADTAIIPHNATLSAK